MWIMSPTPDPDDAVEDSSSLAPSVGAAGLTTTFALTRDREQFRSPSQPGASGQRQKQADRRCEPSRDGTTPADQGLRAGDTGLGHG
jgi:hypothetical protein